MIPIGESAVLGFLQGATEFLPVSSSAHLLLFPWLFGWEDPGLAFDVALHVGTLAAIVVYFWRDWVDIFVTGFGGKGRSDRRTLWLLAVGSVPAAVVGALLEKAAEDAFRSPPLVAAMLALAGLLLYLADRHGKRAKSLSDLGLKDALWVGLAQAAAIVPGVSRSGATISAARALGYGREEAARFSFLLAAPVTAGAAALSLRHLTSADLTDPALAVGVLVSALVGLLAIRFLLGYVSRASYRPFAWYRFGLAIFVAVVFLMKG